MKPKHLFLAALTVISLSTGISFAQEFPKPGPEHNWLQQFVGEWETDTEVTMEPGKPPMKSTGTETVRSLGGFWIMGENKSTMMNMPFTGVMTLGYNPEQKKYIGTWVDSVTGHLWQYEGTTDASGKKLTLETEGVCPLRPGKLTKFREVVELEDNDHKRFMSSMLDENGKWVPMVTGYSRRITKK